MEAENFGLGLCDSLIFSETHHLIINFHFLLFKCLSCSVEVIISIYLTGLV